MSEPIETDACSLRELMQFSRSTSGTSGLPIEVRFWDIPSRFGVPIEVRQNSNPPLILCEHAVVKYSNGKYTRAKYPRWDPDAPKIEVDDYPIPRKVPKVHGMTVAGWNGLPWELRTKVLEEEGKRGA